MPASFMYSYRVAGGEVNPLRFEEIALEVKPQSRLIPVLVKNRRH
jgi:hypothetical protein